MRVRDAMAKGRMLLLCGMDVIYEALYDVLNQRYVRRRTEEGEIELLLRLAIGARSQLCSMAPSFKLLVLVDQDQAFRQLDVPFLNRFMDEHHLERGFEKQLVEPTELLDQARQQLLVQLQAWAEVVALEAGCELVAGGLKPSTLASLLLARPEANLEELKLAIFDMALPLAVFRSKSLQQLGSADNSYFQVRCSLASSMAHVISSADGGILCELSTSSPMAHMPPLQDLAEVGGSSIIPLAQLSGSQQLEDILEKFFSKDSARSSGDRTLVLQVDALSCSPSRLALTRHRCAAKARNRVAECCFVADKLTDRLGAAARSHVFLVLHRVGWTTHGSDWDFQRDFLQSSVYELHVRGLIPSLAEFLGSTVHVPRHWVVGCQRLRILQVWRPLPSGFVACAGRFSKRPLWRRSSPWLCWSWRSGPTVTLEPCNCTCA
ncbi:RNF213 [Symbiodinium pilosum]|uniref:RNF213 protein n=1 Tax=Symbiodinium pilosum TaxID=2952 RepID=A0A812R5V7_SYMPI|nr:RNF213 [Symbiodinium pilosum]